MGNCVHPFIYKEKTMAEQATIDKVMTVLGAKGVTDADLIEEVTDLIESAKADLALAGVVLPADNPESDALILRAILTYCKYNFGEGIEYDRLKRAYDEQKSQLKTSTGYTSWGDDDV